jgi:hypothetical protein
MCWTPAGCLKLVLLECMYCNSNNALKKTCLTLIMPSLHCAHLQKSWFFCLLLLKVHGAWWPPWLAAQYSHYVVRVEPLKCAFLPIYYLVICPLTIHHNHCVQEVISGHWSQHGKPAMQNFQQKVPLYSTARDSVSKVILQAKPSCICVHFKYFRCQKNQNWPRNGLNLILWLLRR